MLGSRLLTALFIVLIGISALVIEPASAMNDEGSNENSIEWQQWSADTFAQAEAQGKPILLNLEAVWCHWCHVMDQQTYSNPAVIDFIQQQYIAIKVDHDARPDLANRYREYGWPATIFMAPDGTDLVKRAGFIKPENFLRLMRAVADDPTPERAALLPPPIKFVAEPALSEAVYDELVNRHKSLFDPKLGGLKTNQKTLDRDFAEYALMQSKIEPQERIIARKTIEASFALQDPHWGGIYQYSTFADWQHPHFEKIMASQAGFMRIYALGFQQYQDPEYLDQANNIATYLSDFLTAPNGAFYTSQDADLIQGEKGTGYFSLNNKERRKLGIPRIDTNIYARENGWAIEALAMLYEAGGDPLHLKQAERAAKQVIATHKQADGGYRHHQADGNAQHLGDSLNMAAGLLALYKVTGENNWLEQAEATSLYIVNNFKAPQAGFFSGLVDPDLPVPPTRNIDENIKTVRLLNLASQYIGSTELKDAAAHGMRYLASPEIAYSRIEDSGILIASIEMAASAPHLTIVGAKTSTRSKELFEVGLQQPGWYKRLEWWDMAEGPLRNQDVTYPNFSKPAGFVCVDRLCSAPAFTPEQYQKMILRIVSDQPH